MHKLKRSTLTICSAVILAALVAGSQVRAQSKVGVFDSQRVSEETAEGRKVQTELSTLRDTKQGEIAGMEQALADLQQRLNQQGLSLSPDTRMALELDIQRRGLELNNAKDLATRELQLEVAAAEARFNEKLRVVVEQFGRDEGFDILFEISATAWSSSSVDITTALIDVFDKMFPAAAE
jgi:Skp family chaperone for outer membrane proteins